MQERARQARDQVTVIIPCKNESEALGPLLDDLLEQFPGIPVIVVDDGSTDDSRAMAETRGATVLSHPYSMGNGAAIKSGLRSASTEFVLCMDADGQHQPDDIAELLGALDDGYDMAVGARSPGAQAGLGRRMGNAIYNRFASLVVGHRIADLTSGMRAMDRRKALEFLHLLPNGFSYPTTMTMAFFRAGYAVSYVPIDVRQRKGKSHISPLKDSIRFLLIIFKVGTLYSPLKIFFPLSVGFFTLGLGYYLFTYITIGRFTNMGALLFLSAAMTFLMGLISEQITALLYQGSRRD